METILNRLNEKQQQVLIDSNILFEDDFLELAEHLSDEELVKLTNVVEGLETLPKRDNFFAQDLSGFSATKALIKSLSSMHENTRSQVLELANAHAAKVASHDATTIYQGDGSLVSIQGSISANDLHNFVNAVVKSDNINLMLEKLTEFDDKQQSDLLHVLGRNQDMGMRLIDELSGRDKAVQDSILGMLSTLTQSANGPTPPITSPYGTVSAILDYDNYGSEVVWGMIEDTISLMENYDFSDEQLQQMGEQLTNLERSDQRAYLSITKTGLAHLLGDEQAQPIKIAEHQAAFESINTLRNNSSVQDIVFKARMGEQSSGKDEPFFVIKEQSVAESSQREMIELLVTDAWLNQENDNPGFSTHSTHSTHSTPLAQALTQLGSEQRDELVNRINEFGQEEIPLARLSAEEQSINYQSFLNRTNSLSNSNDVEALLNVEAETPVRQLEAFWKATELAGDKVDKIVELLQNNKPVVREEIVQLLATLSEQLESGEQSRDDVEKDINSLIQLQNYP